MLATFFPSRRPKGLPRRPQNAHKTPQDAPKTPQDAPRRPQDAPRTPPRRPKAPPDYDFGTILRRFWKTFGRVLEGFFGRFCRQICLLFWRIFGLPRFFACGLSCNARPPCSRSAGSIRRASLLAQGRVKAVASCAMLYAIPSYIAKLVCMGSPPSHRRNSPRRLPSTKTHLSWLENGLEVALPARRLQDAS